jgi:hypothetical protein
MSTLVIVPSGDTTGATDVKAINAALKNNDCVRLDGVYHVNSSVAMTRNRTRLVGASVNTLILPTDKTFSAVHVTCEHAMLQRFTVYGGLNGVHLCNGRYARIIDVSCGQAAQNGLLLTGGVWCTVVDRCRFVTNECDGIRAVNIRPDQNGNATSITSTICAANVGAGICFESASLSVVGCTLESNKAGGCVLTATSGSTNGVSISGTYFENNRQVQIDIQGGVKGVISGVSIRGNYIYSANADPALIRGSGPKGSIANVDIGGNSMYGPRVQKYIDLDAESLM